MNRFQRVLRRNLFALAALGLCAGFSDARTRSQAPDQLKPIKASLNPPQYRAFSEPLNHDQLIQHALTRLTFGPRPGDLKSIENLGLNHWLDLQLSPEQVPENPALTSKLLPLESIRMGIHDTYAHYPPPQLIAAVARGKSPLPEDPQLRDLVVHLSERYLSRKAEKNNSDVNTPADPSEISDLELRVHLSDLLTKDQIRMLRTGTNEEKSGVLASIPPEQQLDFAWSLNRQQRNQLLNLAPVRLRRALLMANQPQTVVTNDLSEAKILRAVYSNHQLQEELSDFWFNHFNVFVNKGSDHFLVPTYEREAIRPNVLGRFYDLLLATVKSPAMLFYLDNWQSVSPDAAGERQQHPNAPRRGLNENYGRELLELHTLGVDAGYTQSDVINVARCFTGWTIATPRKGGEFEYNDKIHDKGRKVVLGHVIPAGGGMDDGLQVLQILARHPSTAHFICLKLARRFVADDPPPSLVARMSKAYLSSDGNLKLVMATMLHSPEFWSKGALQAKIKSPFEMVVSCVRATNADVDSAFQLSSEVARLGEPLYRKVEPTGYASANAEWVSSAGLLERMNFALALAQGRIAGVSVDAKDWQTEALEDPLRLSASLLIGTPSPQTASAIRKMLSDSQMQQQLAANARAGQPQLPRLVAGLTLGSPDFQHR